MKHLFAVATTVVLALTAAGCARGSQPAAGATPAMQVSTNTPVPSQTPSPSPSIDCNTATQEQYMKYCLAPDPGAATGQQPAPPGNGLGVTWNFSDATDIFGSMKFGQQPANKLITEAEEVREEIDAPAVSYLVVTVDNTYGTGTSNLYQVDVVDDQGHQYQTTDLDQLGWLDKAGTNDTARYNRVVKVENDFQFFLQPGAKGTAVKIFKTAPPSVRRVFVYPAGGMTDTEADWR